jgi:formate dehydrogenase iron-sulfur subunit
LSNFAPPGTHPAYFQANLMQIPSTAVDRFSDWHSLKHGDCETGGRYEKLIPLNKPGKGEQYAFQVDLDKCTGCKACVVACHNLNGLDEDESWREVGLMLGSKFTPYRQTVTTACHHCVEPACAHGCPTLAYDKDPETGIVKHLDDQCIGCSYCVLKCPYDAPKYNAKRGIVRKCDMCHGRLAAGEAPACVQSCPNGAIAIKIVKVGGAPETVSSTVAPKDSRPAPEALKAMLPGVFPSDYTQPTTTYISAKPIPAKARPADDNAPRVEEGHTPLAVMLTLSQLSFAGFAAAQIKGDLLFARLGLAALVVGMTASVLHLGQPLKAWKAVLGWRRSWLSREIIALNGFAAAGTAVALGPVSKLPILGGMIPFADKIPAAPAWLALVAGLPAILCTVMVYADTQRRYWSFPRTATRFLGTIAILTAALSGYALVAAFLAAMKMLFEGSIAADADTPFGKLLQGPLARRLTLRFTLGIAGIIALPFSPVTAAALLLAGEFTERTLFFLSASAPRMPGNP